LFRQAIYDCALEEPEALRLAGELEMDEAMFGGQRKGKRGWGAHGKHIVFGIYQRDGRVITFPMPDRKWQTLKPLIERHTERGRGSVYYTDDYHGYVALELRGKHKRVTHKRDEYVREGVHLNGIEGFWSYAKTWLYHYHGVPRSYFHLYLKVRRSNSASTIAIKTSSPYWLSSWCTRSQIVRYYFIYFTSPA